MSRRLQFRTVTWVIANTADVSTDPVDLRTARLVALKFPASMQGTNMGFQASEDNSAAYVAVRDGAGVLTIPITSSAWVGLSLEEAQILRGFIKLDADAVMTADRTVIGIVDDGD